jgi:hypothetical protein
MASRDRVMFMNSGDVFTTPRTAANIMKACRRPDFDWGYGSIRLLSESGLPFAAKTFAPFRLRKFAAGLVTIPHQAVVMKTSFLRGLGGFDSTFGLAADQELLLRAAVRSAPDVWIEFIADFEGGGAGSTRRPALHAGDMRRARKRAGVLLGRTRLMDAGATVFVAVLHSGMSAQRSLRNRGRPTR